jgi:geranylgeranyl reductase family protein
MVRPDAIVVGAGPAGCAAAITLARAGRDVVMIDKARFPRDKCCGDGLTTAALRWLQHLGLEPAAVASWHDVDAAWVRSPSGREVEFPLPRGQGMFAAVSARVDLDAALLEQARAAGVTVREGTAVTSVGEPAPDHVRVGVEHGDDCRASYVIAADGMWSPVRRLIGLGAEGYLGEWHAARSYVGGVAGDAADRLWVWFEADLLPGYAWSFPLGDGRVNIGFGVWRDGRRHGRDLKRVWDTLARRDHIARSLGPHAVAEGPMKAWPIPTRVTTAPLGQGRALLVGDAAGAADPLTGEGIGQALLTGVLAAEAVVAHGPHRPDEVQRSYHHAVRAALAADHRMSAALGRVLRSPNGARGAVRIAGLSTWTRENFARWLFEDEPRAVLLTPRRWHTSLLSRPGAYR